MAHRDSQNLTIDERRFLKNYIELGDLGKAFRTAFPQRKLTDTSCQQSGSRMMARMRTKAGFRRCLDEVGLSDFRLMVELEKRLNATTIKPAR